MGASLTTGTCVAQGQLGAGDRPSGCRVEKALRTRAEAGGAAGPRVGDGERVWEELADGIGDGLAAAVGSGGYPRVSGADSWVPGGLGSGWAGSESLDS